MSNSNGYISAPINTDDVSSVLGVASHDVGYLCGNQHNRINKWAKYKPVRVDTPMDITDAQRKSVNHGLVVVSALKTDGAFNLAEWSYSAPDGTWWKRLKDFIGYNHKAKPPIYILSDEPDENGCTVVTWDEGTTKIDDFKIIAAYITNSVSVGPPSSFDIKMDELNFGASTDIGKCTFGLLQVAGTVKMYLGASKQFNYGIGEAPVCNFGTKFSASSSGYNYLAHNLMNIAVDSYIEVLPVIDTMDFVANRTGVPNSGLTGFPVGKKLRIYHRKTDNWYLTAIGEAISLYYITDKSSGATKPCGYMYHSSSISGGFSRELPADPANQYYELTLSYTFYNNRNYTIDINSAAFYLNIMGGAITIPCISFSDANSVSIPANTVKTVVARFRVTVEEFNSKFAPVPNLSTQPKQGNTFALAFRNPNNIVTRKNTAGEAQREDWMYYYTISK